MHFQRAFRLSDFTNYNELNDTIVKAMEYMCIRLSAQEPPVVASEDIEMKIAKPAEQPDVPMKVERQQALQEYKVPEKRPPATLANIDLKKLFAVKPGRGEKWLTKATFLDNLSARPFIERFLDYDKLARQMTTTQPQPIDVLSWFRSLEDLPHWQEGYVRRTYTLKSIRRLSVFVVLVDDAFGLNHLKDVITLLINGLVAGCKAIVPIYDISSCLMQPVPDTAASRTLYVLMETDDHVPVEVFANPKAPLQPDDLTGLIAAMKDLAETGGILHSMLCGRHDRCALPMSSIVQLLPKSPKRFVITEDNSNGIRAWKTMTKETFFNEVRDFKLYNCGYGQSEPCTLGEMFPEKYHTHLEIRCADGEYRLVLDVLFMHRKWLNLYQLYEMLVVVGLKTVVMTDQKTGRTVERHVSLQADFKDIPSDLVTALGGVEHREVSAQQFPPNCQSRKQIHFAEGKWESYGEERGSGTYGSFVQLCRSGDCSQVGVKIVKVPRGRIDTGNLVQDVLNEIEILLHLRDMASLKNRTITPVLHNWWRCVEEKHIKFYLEMDQMTSTLSEWLKNNVLTLRVVEDLRTLMTELSDDGIVHNDLSPANIMYLREITKGGQTSDIFQVIDFGFAYKWKHVSLQEFWEIWMANAVLRECVDCEGLQAAFSIRFESLATDYSDRNLHIKTSLGDVVATPVQNILYENRQHFNMFQLFSMLRGMHQYFLVLRSADVRRSKAPQPEPYSQSRGFPDSATHRRRRNRSILQALCSERKQSHLRELGVGIGRGRR